ncbi:MAG: exodeoxyribonuclease VII large subunit [Patescibacteria group bacterium]|nr:exodeoxyribonuclease VII large subunit [Patescibacteria group bacterium]
MQPDETLELGVTEFVALLNQTLDYAYSGVVITGELANLRVSKNRWVYFDLKDDDATVKFFGTVYHLPGPLEDGMILKVRGQPKLHNLYGFSVNVQSIQTAGEGSIRRAAELLQAKLQAAGLFDADRKRQLPYPPQRIGLVASKQSAAYADFVKIIDARWGGIIIQHIDVQVQGEVAPAQIVAAIEQFNALPEPPNVLVLIRGGGSAEDLAAFSTDQVTRAVAGSRVPTLVAIGHEIDVCLAELAADQRASTPSNAAELLVPDRQQSLLELDRKAGQLAYASERVFTDARLQVEQQGIRLHDAITLLITGRTEHIAAQSQLLRALSPEAILRRGYAIVRHQNRTVREAMRLKQDDIITVQVATGMFDAAVLPRHKE